MLPTHGKVACPPRQVLITKSGDCMGPKNGGVRTEESTSAIEIREGFIRTKIYTIHVKCYPARQNADFGQNCPPISEEFRRKNSSIVPHLPLYKQIPLFFRPHVYGFRLIAYNIDHLHHFRSFFRRFSTFCSVDPVLQGISFMYYFQKIVLAILNYTRIQFYRLYRHKCTTVYCGRQSVSWKVLF